MKAYLAHDAIHQESRTCHVAGVLQQPDEEKENKDLRKEDDNASHTGQHAVCKKIPEIP